MRHQDYLAIMVEAGYLIPEPEPRNGMSMIDTFYSQPHGSRVLTFDVGFDQRIGSYNRISGYFLKEGIDAGLDQRGWCVPFTPGHSLFIGRVLKNEISNVQVVKSGRYKENVKGATAAHVGRPVYSVGPAGPYSVDPADGGRIGYIVYIEPRSERCCIQICQHFETPENLGFSPGYQKETIGPVTIGSVEKFGKPRVKTGRK